MPTKITSVSCYCSCVRKMFINFTDNGRKIYTVGRSIPCLISKLLAVNTVEFIYPCFRSFGIFGTQLNSPLMTSLGLAGMPKVGCQTRPTSFASGQICTKGSWGLGAVGKVYD